MYLDGGLSAEAEHIKFAIPAGSDKLSAWRTG